MTLEDYLRQTSLHDVGVERVRRKDAVLELDLELDAEAGEVSRLTLRAPTLTAEPGWEIFDWPPGVDGEILRFDSTRRDGSDDFEVVMLIHRYDGGQADVGVVRGRCEALTVERLEPAGYRPPSGSGREIGEGRRPPQSAGDSGKEGAETE